MAVINAAEMLDNLAAATAQGELMAVAKLGITPDDFRLLMNAFDGSPVRDHKTLDQTKRRRISETTVAGRKYTFIKTSPIKSLKKGHALHNRMICEVRSEAWRILFNVAVNSHPVDEFAKIRAKTPTEGWAQCFNLVCVGDEDAMQREVVLLKMFL